MALFKPGPSTTTQETAPSAAAQARLAFILQLLQLATAQGAPGLGGGIAARMRGGGPGGKPNPLGSPEAQKALADYMAATKQPGATTTRTTSKTTGASPSMFQDLTGLLMGGLLLNQLFSTKDAKGDVTKGGFSNIFELLKAGAGKLPGVGGSATAADFNVPADQLGVGDFSGIDFSTQASPYSTDEMSLLFPNENIQPTTQPWWNFWS